ncbi:MAG: ABC transporter ATP-binding protein [Planctomycetota bacterium]
MTPAIQFDSVHRRFGDLHVLRGLSFTVEPGQIYAFLGRNGAGKTTALRILLGFQRPHRGRATVLGVDSTALRPEHRARIGHVGEGHKLDPTMRIADAVAFEQGTRPGFDRAFVDGALQRCQLRPRHWLARLSRGQRAQVALVLAVATRPEVLVFDDPAMGLDVVMRREFLDAMIDLLADSGVSVLFSSHILTDVERIADRVGILHEGAMLVDATMDDLKRRVTRRTFAPHDGAAPAGERLLRTGRRRDGYDLTLLDEDAALLQDLARRGRLGEAASLSLEDLFLDLTGPDRPGLLSEPMAWRIGRLGAEVLS